MSCNCCGGWTKQNDLNSETVKSVAEFAFNDLKMRSNSAYALKLVSIKECCTQVVAGVNYKIKLEIGGGKTNYEKTVTVYKKLDGTMEVTKLE